MQCQNNSDDNAVTLSTDVPLSIAFCFWEKGLMEYVRDVHKLNVAMANTKEIVSQFFFQKP